MINLIGLLDGIIGLDYWMVFFHPNSDVAVVHSSQGRFFFVTPTLTWLWCIPRRGLFLFFFCILAQNCHIWSNKIISGPDFLKNDDI